MAQSGNGIDVGMIYQLLTQVSERLDQVLAVVNDHSRILGDHSQILSGHGRQLDDLAAEMKELHSRVGLYHEAVVSQGLHYSDLEGRMLRVERHLKLEPSSG